MNEYRYTCLHCGSRFSKESEDTPKTDKCPDCNKPIKCKTIIFDGKKKPFDGININCTMQSRERLSDAMGCHPDQIPTFKAKWPWMNFTKDGRCIVGSRAEKKRIMKARGMVEYE